MLQLPNIALPSKIQRQLDTLQQEIDAINDYATQVETAKRKFSQHNRARNPTFKVVRTTLRRMCSGAERCGYCEDSYADEIEHIKPKTLYPEATFIWRNYLYACGPCNGPKNNRFVVFSPANGAKVDVTRKRGEPVVPPEAGDPVLINPRRENPLEFMWLDLINTFYFLPMGDEDSQTYIRAEYTIEVLRLNERDYLLAAREEAFDSYRARLSEYVIKRNQGAKVSQLNNLINSLKRMGQPTIWKEMKRQQKLIPELEELFSVAPEALDW